MHGTVERVNADYYNEKYLSDPHKAKFSPNVLEKIWLAIVNVVLEFSIIVLAYSVRWISFVPLSLRFALGRT